jgi:hypothetical protein
VEESASIAHALSFARSSEDPASEEAFTDVYATRIDQPTRTEMGSR